MEDNLSESALVALALTQARRFCLGKAKELDARIGEEDDELVGEALCEVRRFYEKRSDSLWTLWARLEQYGELTVVTDERQVEKVEATITKLEQTGESKAEFVQFGHVGRTGAVLKDIVVSDAGNKVARVALKPGEDVFVRRFPDEF